jgi:uncharacterized Ntn-hydrolase superfamily protein
LLTKPLGTFTILAISQDSNLMGVATASGSINVGDRVPHAKPGIGVIATQAYTNVVYGIKGLELLQKGLSPEEALAKLLREDSERSMRQVAIMDFKRRKAVFTGSAVGLKLWVKTTLLLEICSLQKMLSVVWRGHLKLQKAP